MSNLLLSKKMNWEIKAFAELSSIQLYDILKLRNEVFIVEQNCPYQDIDGKDLKALHLMGSEAGQLAAYCRLLPAGVSYPEASIGRVISSPRYRAKGLGQALMHHAIEAMEAQFGKAPIHIGAQYYLKRFYESFGFIQTSDIYLEDGIEHIEMLRQ